MSADETFEELGFNLKFEDEISFALANRAKARYITFLKDTKTLMVSSNMTMQELQAIYQKCKELGWIRQQKDNKLDKATLIDFFISSVDKEQEPVWTEEYIEELLDNFDVIPKEDQK